MGWCSGTDIFDDMAGFILGTSATDDEKAEILTTLVNSLEDQDWDCQDDSAFRDDPVVQRVFKTLHPDWDWD